MKSALIPITERAAWQQGLEGLPHALAHSWEYNYALSLTPAYANTQLWRGELNGVRVACPLIERRWQGVTDVATPYGFSGFAADCPESSGPDDFLPAWQALARQQGWACGYVGLHPWLDRRLYPASETSSTSHVYMLDLTLSEASIEAGFSDNLRARLQQWERSGAQLTRDRELCRRFFCTQYPVFMQRVQASAAYAFSQATLAALFDHPDVFALGATGPQGLEAVSVFGATRECGEYLFSVALASGRHHSAQLLRAGLAETRQRGAAAMNLGGGIQPDDGLDAFKARFGGARWPVRALKQVYDEVIFQRCCAAVGAKAEARAGYFPPYRAVPARRKTAGQVQGVRSYEIECRTGQAAYAS